MWEVDRKEVECQSIDAFELWCWEKTLESPLDCKEIKSVNLEGNQSWIFLEKTSGEAEAPILWPLDEKSRLFATPWTAISQVSLSFTISQSLLKLMSIELVMTSSHLIFCHPLLLLPSIFPSIRGFSKELALHIRWPKYWSFCFSISPSNEYSGLLSFRIDWFDLLAVQGILKSLQHHGLKASILWHSVFFMVQLSHPYMTTGKTIALTIQTFVSKVMSLIINTLSRFIIVFLSRSKHFLISWLQSLSDLEPKWFWSPRK